MRLVIDLQGAQSANRERAIGRYSLAVVKEIVRQRGQNEVFLALSGLFPETIDPLRGEFDDLLPQDHIVVWDAPPSVRFVDEANAARREAAEILRESFLSALAPDVVLITSVFEGMMDDAVVSIGHFNPGLRTAVILYDLMPLLHADLFLGDDTALRWYLNKLDHLRRADRLLTVSTSVSRDAAAHLLFPETDVATIARSCDSRFQVVELGDQHRAHLARSHAVTRNFVLSAAVHDGLSDNAALIRIYASLPRKVRAEHQLVLASPSITPDQDRDLKTLARENGLAEDDLLILTQVGDADLVLLYNACTLFVFPACRPGFDLTPLEAMSCGAAVITSDTLDLLEIVGDEAWMFDLQDMSTLREQMLELLTSPARLKAAKDHATQQAARFSAGKSAALAWDQLSLLCVS